MGTSRLAGAWLLAFALLASVPSLLAQQQNSTGSSAKLPSADELLDRSVQASGGREAWLKLTSMHIKGDVQIAASGMSGTMDIYSQAPASLSDCVKFEVGVFFCRTYDGTTGWQDDSQFGLKELEGKDLAEMKRDADFYTVLNERKNYSSLRTAKETEFDGAKVYVIEGVRNDGQKMELYYSKDTGLAAGWKEIGGSENQAKTIYFEKYKPVAVVGVKIPTRIRSVTETVDLRLDVQEVEPNLHIPEATFRKPGKSARDSSAADISGDPENGHVANELYSNEFFSFSYAVPHGWTVHGEETNKVLSQVGTAMIAGDDAAKKAAMESAHKRSHNLLTVFEFPLGTPGKENRGIQVVAEAVAFAPGIKSGRDYVLVMRQLLSNSQMHIEFDGDPIDRSFSGVPFSSQTSRNIIGSKVVFQTVYSTIMNGYAVSFVFSAPSKESLQETEQSMSSFRTTATTQAKP